MGTTPTLYLSNIADAKQLLGALELLTQSNASYFSLHPNLPDIYQSGIYYDNEKPGHEDWLGAEALLRIGWGDCEDLAAYLAGWYRARRHIMAKVVLKRFSKKGKTWYHAVVKLPNGTLEDPSARLGMRS